jgi:hypothetical protein
MLTPTDTTTQAPNARGFSRVIRNPSRAHSVGFNPDILIPRPAPAHHRNESATPLDARLGLTLPLRKAPLAIAAIRC